MRTELLLAEAVQDLHLEPVGGGIRLVVDAEIESGIASLRVLVLEIDCEVLVVVLQPEVGAVAAPAPLPGAGLEIQ